MPHGSSDQPATANPLMLIVARGMVTAAARVTARQREKMEAERARARKLTAEVGASPGAKHWVPAWRAEQEYQAAAGVLAAARQVRAELET